MNRISTMQYGRETPHGLSLNNYKVDFIDFDDRPDTAVRVAKKCIERPGFITGLPDMPRLSDEPRRRFSTVFRG